MEVGFKDDPGRMENWAITNHLGVLVEKLNMSWQNDAVEQMTLMGLNDKEDFVLNIRKNFLIVRCLAVEQSATKSCHHWRSFSRGFIAVYKGYCRCRQSALAGSWT